MQYCPSPAPLDVAHLLRCRCGTVTELKQRLARNPVAALPLPRHIEHYSPASLPPQYCCSSATSLKLPRNGSCISFPSIISPLMVMLQSCCRSRCSPAALDVTFLLRCPLFQWPSQHRDVPCHRTCDGTCQWNTPQLLPQYRAAGNAVEYATVPATIPPYYLPRFRTAASIRHNTRRRTAGICRILSRRTSIILRHSNRRSYRGGICHKAVKSAGNFP